jgi:polysaccharide biosynthesis protein PslJ
VTSIALRQRATPAAWVVLSGVAASVTVPALMLQFPLTAVLLALAGATGLALLLTIPVRWLPSAVLLAFALLPVAVLPGNRITASLSPVLATTLVWVFRCYNQPRLRPWPKILCGFLVIWLLALTVTSIDHRASVLWSMNLFLLVIAIVWLASKTPPRAIRLLGQTWMILGAALGALALVEHLLGHNPIPYLGTHYTLTQEYWSVYRVTTTLGTPLVNGTFFAAALAIAWVRLTSCPSLFAMVSFLGAGSGLVFSYTRGAFLGAGVALVVVTIAGFMRRGGDIGLKVLGVIVLSVACIGGYTAIQVRAQSAEASYSATLRSQAVRAATTIAAEHHYLGSGPGTSHRAQLAAGTTAVAYYSQRSGIENSYLQFLVSIGIPGAAVVCLLIAVMLIGSLRRHAYAGAGALVAVAISAGGYSMAEDAVPTLALIGLAMLLGVGDSLAHHEPDAVEADVASRAGTQDIGDRAFVGNLKGSGALGRVDVGQEQKRAARLVARR